MSGHRMPWPNGTDFVGGVVADGKDEVHLRRTGRGELVPGFAAKACYRYSGEFELSECFWPDSARGMAACAVSLEGTLRSVVQNTFRQNGPGGVASAKEEDVVCRSRHYALACVESQQPGPQHGAAGFV